MYNFDVVFLGGLFPKETETEIVENSKGSIQNAANNLQWEFVKGLDASLQNPLRIINSLYIGSFPKRYTKMVIDTYNFCHLNSNSKDINVGFLNITGIKNFSRYYSLKPYLKTWAVSRNDRKKIIIAYAMTSTFTHLLRYVKKLNKDIVTCLIVPDLPQYMNLSSHKNMIYTVQKNIEIKCIQHDMEYIDSYVLLTKYMSQALNINVPYVVVEGIATNSFDDVGCIPQEKGVKTILYSGGLTKRYGVLDMIHAFEQIPEVNYRLIICGSGDIETEVINASNRDKRIIYKGLLKRDEVLQLQKSCTVLINPRPKNGEYTKYSFPSKIMEYMSSGTPVIAYKLEGIPEEYYEHIYMVNDDKGGLFGTLKDVLCKDEQELFRKGQIAKEFVLTQKSGEKQGEKILQMLNHL